MILSSLIEFSSGDLVLIVKSEPMALPVGSSDMTLKPGDVAMILEVSKWDKPSSQQKLPGWKMWYLIMAKGSHWMICETDIAKFV